MEHLPGYISIAFGLTTGLAVALFCRAARRPLPPLMIIPPWLALQGFIASTGFYTVTDGTPPRLALVLVPPLLLIAGLFVTRSGRQFTDGLNLRALTLLHIVRIPVEVVLFRLYLHKAIPGLMTFEGMNPDILSGLSAMLLFYFGWAGNRPRRGLLLAWNGICLLLLVNIVALALLTAPSPLQRLAFEQPNIALLYFPFVWLPCCVVPLVLLSHLAAIRQLLMKRGE